MTPLADRSDADVEHLLRDAEKRLADHRSRGFALDLTRGKPGPEQLDLSTHLDGLLQGDFRAEDGTDTRNYGGLLGIDEARALGGRLLGVPADSVLAGGNSSLTLMYQAMETAHLFGLDGPGSAWRETAEHGTIRCLCPVPGYDRHFTVCEALGIEMVPVPMTPTGPDMEAVEERVAGDPDVRAIWCVPKYSNPTGVVYDEDTVARLAALGSRAGPGFRVFWDNAYAVHDLYGPRPLPSLHEAARARGTEESILQFASTSKITLAGAGVAFLAAGPRTLDAFVRRLSTLMICPDKVNQLRHARAFPDDETLAAHMRRHAEALRPRFEATQAALERLGPLRIADWTRPEGGYFVSVDLPQGTARAVVELAGAAGVKLTPAGATWPYGRDPEDRNLRLAPSFPSVDDVRAAMEVFVDTVILVAARQRLGRPLTGDGAP